MTCADTRIEVLELKNLFLDLPYAATNLKDKITLA
jgi:hypothetical protein